MTGQRVILPTGNAATHYGPRGIESQLPSEYVSSQGDKTLSIPFSFDTLPTISLEDDSVLALPALSRVVSATLTIVDSFAGGTSLNVGLYTLEGPVIDADGLLTAVSGGALGFGAINDGDGVLIGSAFGLPVAGQVVVEAVGTFTAGKAVLEVVYQTNDNRG